MSSNEIETRLQKESKKLQSVGDRLRAVCFQHRGIEKSADELQSIAGRLRDSKNQDILTKELPAFVNKLQDVTAQIPPSRGTESSEVLEELPLIEAEIRSALDQLQDAMKGFQSAADRMKALCNREAKEVERVAEELHSIADRLLDTKDTKTLEEELREFTRNLQPVATWSFQSGNGPGNAEAILAELPVITKELQSIVNDVQNAVCSRSVSDSPEYTRFGVSQ